MLRWKFLRRHFQGRSLVWDCAKEIGPAWIDLAGADAPESCDDFFDFEFAIVGDKLTLFVNGRLLLPNLRIRALPPAPLPLAEAYSRMLRS